MKKSRLFIYLVLMLTACLNACQKDIDFIEGSGPGSSLPPVTISMSAKVNGTLVSCDIINATLENSTNYLSLSGEKGVESFQFQFQDFNGVGVYNAADLFSSALYTNGIDPVTQVFFADSGNINITLFNDTSIRGTFDFIAINSVGDVKNITEGKFLAKIIKN